VVDLAVGVVIGAAFGGVGVVTASVTTLMSLAIAPGEQGRVRGGTRAVRTLAQAAGPLLSGQVYARLGPSATFGAGAAVVVVALSVLSGTPLTGEQGVETVN